MTAGTRIINLGAQRVEGVMFVPRQPAVAPPPRTFDTGRPDLSYVTTDDLSRAAGIRDCIVGELARARRKVLFCSFLFADEAIVAALCDAAERMHGGVYVLTTLAKHLQPQVLFDLDAALDASAEQLKDRAARHEQHLRRLASAGVWLRSVEDCHAKFCVFDDDVSIVTSANATPEAYESNPEHGIVVRSAVIATELGRLFAQVWLELAAMESTPGSLLDLRSLRPRSTRPWRPLRGSHTVTPVATLRKAEASLQAAAIDVIEGASHHLTIATYSFSGMEQHPIGQALSRAVERGVEIDLLLQPRNHLAAQRATCSWLIAVGPSRVRLYGHRRTHAKSIVADDGDVLLWTGNLEAAHGWNDGIEVGLRIRDSGVACAVAGWTRSVMARQTHHGVRSPSAAELVAAGEKCGLTGHWKLFPSRAMSGERIAAMVARAPVEVLKHRGGVTLRCGSEGLLDVRIDGPARTIHVVGIHPARTTTSGQNLGWAADCTWTLEEPATSQPTEAGSGRRRNGGKRGRRR